MRILLSIFIACSILGSVLSPAVAFAQLPSFTGWLVPCGHDCITDDNKKGIRECTVCDFVALLQRILNFLIFAAAVIATLLFVYAGFLMVSAGGNESQLSQAKGIFLNVLIGFIIVLASWLIVGIIMTTFYDTAAGNGRPWNQIICNDNVGGKGLCVPLERPELKVKAITPPPLQQDKGAFCFRLQQAATDPDFPPPPCLICFRYFLESNKENARQTCLTQIDLVSGAIPGSCAEYPPGTVSTCGGGPDTSGVCHRPLTGYCSQDSLRPYFGNMMLALEAGQICHAESAGIPHALSRTDVLRNVSGTPSFSIGLFQINITVHNLMIPECDNLECTKAFTGRNYSAVFAGMNPDGTIPPDNLQTVMASERLYRACVAALQKPDCNAKKAFEIYSRRGNWLDWSTARGCKLRPFH